jgi:hypothetical protein
MLQTIEEFMMEGENEKSSKKDTTPSKPAWKSWLLASHLGSVFSRYETGILGK